MSAWFQLLRRNGGRRNSGSRQGAVQLRHRLQRQRFGPGLCRNAGWPRRGEFFDGISGGTQIVLQRLSLLREALPQKTIEPGSIDAELGKARRKLQPQHGGVDIRRRRERRRWEGEEVVYLCVHLRSRREQTVVANAWSSGDAVGHLALHHQNRTGDQPRTVCSKELQQNIRRDVVRQIPDDVSGFAIGYKRSKVGFENVGFDNLYLRLIAKSEGQFGGQVPIEFQRNQPAAAPDEYLGDGAMARSNLDHGPLANIAKGVDDGMAGSIIHKKVLPDFVVTFHTHRW